MVFESILSPLSAEKYPWNMFFLGILYSSLGVVLSLWIFHKNASLVMVFLTVLAAIPFMYQAMKCEEEKDVDIEDERMIMRSHYRPLVGFMLLFFGMTIAYTLWYALSPINITQALFNIQTETIVSINNGVTGNVTSMGIFLKIFLNNVKVLAFCILFAFLYGAGAVFVLTWNASVIGAAMGNFIRSNMGRVAELIGLLKVAGYFQVLSLSLLRYAIHGIPEILGYVLGGLAGGIISMAIVNHDMFTEKFERIVFDSSTLLVVALLCLLAAGLLEVYVTPILF